jgi:rhamnopyranosyl-N-acetylglucosaminyl-diphospho-decaprenol beta-1,3/1,4-galactofuranosyltransferase
MDHYSRIAVVFATMNRADVAIACVTALAKQTRPPELVLVADNVSNDDTPEKLEALTNLPFEMIVHRMPANGGNAGGIHAVMELAFQKGADAVWILDDDSWPRPGALEAMLDGGIDPKVVRHPLQIDPKTHRFTWPQQIRKGESEWNLIWDESELPSGSRTRSRIAWTGALLPREVYQVVGPVNSALFIRGEDEEYPLRIEQAGFTQEAVHGAILDHPGPSDLVEWRLLGKHFFFERGLADWKLYYKVRNMVWLKRRHSGNFRAVSIAVIYLLSACWLDGISRFSLMMRAISDGWCGRLGKMEN